MSGPRITDNALLRFLGFAGGQDMEGVRAELQASLARAHTAALTLGATEYLIRSSGLVFVVRNATVTTVHHDDGSASRRAFALRKVEPQL